jgi:hypothetical protein
MTVLLGRYFCDRLLVVNQQVHIARKIISREAQKRNQTFIDYIKSSEKRLMEKHHEK